MAAKNAEQQLRTLLAKHDPDIVHLVLSLRSLVREVAPDANEIVYDAGYTVSDIFSFTDRWQDSFCYIAPFSKHVNLGFTWGAKLPDPGRRLRGKGKQMRHLQVRSDDDIESDDLRTLLEAAIAKGRLDKSASRA